MFENGMFALLFSKNVHYLSEFAGFIWEFQLVLECEMR